MGDTFAPRFQAYREAVHRARQEAPERVRQAFLAFLRDALGLDLGTLPPERPFAPGRVGALLGDLVFVFRQDLRREGAGAEAQLRRLVRVRRAERPRARLTAVATDGLRFRLYRPAPNTSRLEALGEADLGATGPEPARRFLHSLLAHLLPTPLPSDPDTVRALFGPSSPSFRAALADLERMARALRRHPSYRTRRAIWRRHLETARGPGGEDEGLFLRHTYLALLARLLGALALGFPPVPSGREDPAGLLDGAWFRGQGVENFGEEDLFSWPLLDPVRAEGLELVEALLQALSRVDLSRLPEGVLKGLYEDLRDPPHRPGPGEPCTSDRPAERVLGEVLDLPGRPDATVLDPACGAGAFLCVALRLLRQALEARGLPPYEVAFRLARQVVGVDAHPLAVAVARTHWLLALRDLLQAERPPVAIPVFLADALLLPDASPHGEGEPPSYRVSLRLGRRLPRPVWELPARAAEDPWTLLRLVDRLAHYYAPAVLACREAGPQEERVFRAFHAYLTMPKSPRAEVPLRFTLPEAEALEGVLRTYVRLVREGHNGLWAHLLGHAFIPLALHRTRFDLVVGSPPCLPLRNPRHARVARGYRLLRAGTGPGDDPFGLAALFFVRCADLYLKEGGRIAFVLPKEVPGRVRLRGALPLRWEGVLDLEGPGTASLCVAVAVRLHPTAQGSAREPREGA